MAASVHPAAKSAPRTRALQRLGRGLALWHLLSLDAPTVAMLWTWFAAREEHVYLRASAVAAVGIAVWMLYAADRLLDSRALRAGGPAPSRGLELEARHYFHRNHQAGFRLGLLAASIALAPLLPAVEPRAVRLYLVLGTLLLGYFILIHAGRSKAHRLPKELAVGVFFSSAAFVPTVAKNPSLRAALLPGAVLFAALCSLNCLFIYCWEHPFAGASTHPATRLALRRLPHLAAAAALSGAALALGDGSLPWPISAACALSALSLLLLNRARRRFSPTTLRAAADLCLLTPLLLLRF